MVQTARHDIGSVVLNVHTFSQLARPLYVRELSSGVRIDKSTISVESDFREASLQRNISRTIFVSQRAECLLKCPQAVVVDRPVFRSPEEAGLPPVFRVLDRPADAIIGCCGRACFPMIPG